MRRKINFALLFSGTILSTLLQNLASANFISMTHFCYSVPPLKFPLSSQGGCCCIDRWATSITTAVLKVSMISGGTSGSGERLHGALVTISF